MSSKNEITVTVGLRKWVTAAVFIGWLTYYSLTFASWRIGFAEWYASAVVRHGAWVR